MTHPQSADPTDSQKAHIGRILYRLESLAVDLRPDLWVETGQSDTIAAARQHLQQAYEHLQQAIPLVTDALTHPAHPLSTAEFLNTPLMQIPDVNTGLFNRLWVLSKELSNDNRTSFTAQELLNTGLTLSRFQRVSGVGKTKLTELQALFQAYGVTIPLV